MEDESAGGAGDRGWARQRWGRSRGGTRPGLAPPAPSSLHLTRSHGRATLEQQRAVTAEPLPEQWKGCRPPRASLLLDPDLGRRAGVLGVVELHLAPPVPLIPPVVELAPASYWCGRQNRPWSSPASRTCRGGALTRMRRGSAEEGHDPRWEYGGP